jgi:ABC-type phosphate/phosphonate transport system ATPase subunit
MLFKIERDYIDVGYKLHAKSEIEIQPGVTVLIGCNGAGKSTLLMQLRDICNKDGFPTVYYDNLRHGGDNAVSKAAFHDDWDFVASSIMSSEGENIVSNIARVAANIGRIARNAKDKFFVFMDAVDSGLSVDNIIDLKELLFKTALEDCNNRGVELYIIISANEYELCNG